MKALHAIAEELDRIVADVREGEPVDDHLLHVLARRVEAQAEMIEGEIAA